MTLDYRDTIRQTLETRAARNPRYSLRSFARDLGISPSRLSDVLNRRYGLSVAAATDLARGLGLNEDESKRFCDQVEAQHARDRRKRNAALARVAVASVKYNSLSADSFQVISDWYHYAIIELCFTKGFRSCPDWIARQLELSPAVARAAIDRLKRLELLRVEENGQLAPSQNFYSSPEGTPSEAVRKFHRQVLEKALVAIDCQTMDERDLGSMIVAIDPAQLPEAKTEIRKFRRSFDAKYGAGENRTQVYCLATQLFRLQAKPGDHE